MANPQPTPALATIAAAQAERTIFAFDRDAARRQLARLQTIYAAKGAQLDALCYLFDEGTPDLVLRSSTREVILRPTDGTADVYPVLHDALYQSLRQLEGEIVAAHLDIERNERERTLTQSEEGPDYTPHILALCQPAAAATAPAPYLSREQLTERETAAHARAEAAAALEQPTDLVARSQAAQAIGAQYLWHLDFPASFPQQLACLDLFRLTAELPDLLQELNGGQALDVHDYAYLSDVLRVALAKGPAAHLRLLQERTLSWVEAAAA